MYITQYHPNDLIFDSNIYNFGISYLFMTNLQQLSISSDGMYFYLSMILPETVINTLIFKFYTTTSAAFKIAVDQYTNSGENYGVDYYNPSAFINEQVTSHVVAGFGTKNINVLTHEYNGFGHKIASDRCIFRLKNNLASTINLVGILVKAK